MPSTQLGRDQSRPAKALPSQRTPKLGRASILRDRLEQLIDNHRWVEVNRMKPIFVSFVTPRRGPKKYTLNLFSHWPRSMLADQSSINFTNGRNFGRRPGKKRFLRG